MAAQLYCCGLTRVLQSLQKWYLAAVQCLTFNKKCLCCKEAPSWFRVPISQTKNMKWGSRKDVSNARLRTGSCLCSLPIVILSSRWTITCWHMEANGKGCRKDVGPKNRLWLKLAGGLTGACFRIQLLYISIEIMRSLASKTTKTLLQSSSFPSSCLVCPCLVITSWSTARSQTVSAVLKLYGALRGHNPFLPHWGREKGDKCWTNLWELARVRDGTMASELRKYCLSVSAILANFFFFFFLQLCSSGIFLLGYKAVF